MDFSLLTSHYYWKKYACMQNIEGSRLFSCLILCIDIFNSAFCRFFGRSAYTRLGSWLVHGKYADKRSHLSLRGRHRSTNSPSNKSSVPCSRNFTNFAHFHSYKKAHLKSNLKSTESPYTRVRPKIKKPALGKISFRTFI